MAVRTDRLRLHRVGSGVDLRPVGSTLLAAENPRQADTLEEPSKATRPAIRRPVRQGCPGSEPIAPTIAPENRRPPADPPEFGSCRDANGASNSSPRRPSHQPAARRPGTTQRWGCRNSSPSRLPRAAGQLPAQSRYNDRADCGGFSPGSWNGQSGEKDQHRGPPADHPATRQSVAVWRPEGRAKFLAPDRLVVRRSTAP